MSLNRRFPSISSAVAVALRGREDATNAASTKCADVDTPLPWSPYRRQHVLHQQAVVVRFDLDPTHPRPGCRKVEVFSKVGKLHLMLHVTR